MLHFYRNADIEHRSSKVKDFSDVEIFAAEFLFQLKRSDNGF